MQRCGLRGRGGGWRDSAIPSFQMRETRGIRSFVVGISDPRPGPPARFLVKFPNEQDFDAVMGSQFFAFGGRRRHRNLAKLRPQFDIPRNGAA